MPLTIVRSDITTMDVDVIVNAANSALQRGGGVCGAIFAAAGTTDLQNACDEAGGCAVGRAVMTDAFQLPAEKIIHTVGPIWQGGTANEEVHLTQCYQNSLALAVEHNYKSIAFPLISSGIYGYPKDQALEVATHAIRTFLLDHDIHVYLVVFDQHAFQLSEKRFDSVSAYIDEHYVAQREEPNRRRHRIEVEYDQVFELQEESVFESNTFPIEMPQSKRSLEDVLAQMDESFAEGLLRLIDEKGMTDVETYRKANIDRRLFSKIRNQADYTPLKKTVLAFAIALELNLDETTDFLNKAGYALSRSNKFDVIIEYFIEEANYNIYEINEVLFSFEQILLGA